MSKLDREITLIIDDVGANAKAALEVFLPVIFNEDLTAEQKTKKIEEILETNMPKTYDVFIADIKQVFREAGWKEPKL